MTQLPSPALETSFASHVAVLTWAMLFPTATTLAYFIVLAGDPSMGLAYGFSKIAQFAVPIVWVLAVQRRRIAWTRPDRRSVLWGIAFGLAAVAVGLITYFGYFKSSPLLAGTPELVADKVRGMRLDSPTKYVLFALFLALPHSLLEEYYWRWFVFGQLRRVASLRVALALSSLAFMSHHVIVISQFVPNAPGVALFSLCVAFGGAVWAWLYHRCGSLYGPWASHALLDCGVMVIGYDLVFA